MHKVVLAGMGGRGGMGAGMRGGGGMGGGMGAAMLDQLNLTPAEKTAVEKAMADKMRANQGLQTELQRLRAVAERQGLTAADAKKAVAAYLEVKSQVGKKNVQIDATLMKSLSPVAQAKALAFGILDNGLGMRGMMGGRGGMGGRGRMGGGQGGPPGP